VFLCIGKDNMAMFNLVYCLLLGHYQVMWPSLHSVLFCSLTITVLSRFNDGDMLWEMRCQVISSLCERHRVYLHKPV
jgi:hypothetical protein